MTQHSAAALQPGTRLVSEQGVKRSPFVAGTQPAKVPACRTGPDESSADIAQATSPGQSARTTRSQRKADANPTWGSGAKMHVNSVPNRMWG